MKIKIAKGNAWQKIRDFIYVINHKTGFLYQLDNVSLNFWELVSSNNNFEEIITKLSHMYDAPFSTIYSDMKNLVYKLEENFLLEVFHD